MSIQSEIERMTGKSDAPVAKAAKPKTVKATKAQSPAQRKGFKARDLSKALIAKAKQVWAQYQKDPKAPKVTERDGSWRRGPMLAIAYVWGFTSNADADAKVQALQTALGKPLTGPNGVMDFASDNPIKRQKCMGTTVAKEWQARAAKDGVYFLKPTSPQARRAVEAIADQGKRTGGKPVAKGKTVKPKATDAASRNGTVKVSVDKALRNAAKAAERNALRKANRAKQAAQGKPEAVSTEQ